MLMACSKARLFSLLTLELKALTSYSIHFPYTFSGSCDLIRNRSNTSPQ